MKFLLLVIFFLLAATLVWPKLWDGHDLQPGEYGAIFSLRELVGVAIAICAVAPLLHPISRGDAKTVVPLAVAGVLAGVCVASFSWGATLGLGALGSAYLLGSRLSNDS